MSAIRPPPISPRVRPTQERAVRAVKALDEGRWLDARKNAAALPDTPIAELAWKTYLLGRVHLALDELKDAEVALERAAALAMEWAAAGNCPGGPATTATQPPEIASEDAARLAAEAFEFLGRALRRGERGRQAIRAHVVAYGLRSEHGSAFERWESADSLAIDHALGGQLVESKTWYERALAHAESAGFQCQAKSLYALSTTHLALGDADSASQTAKAGCVLWQRHAPGSPARFSVEKQLGLCLLRQAEASFETAPARAGELLREAAAVLRVAHQELVAFGEEAGDEARACAELLDFAQRLRNSLSTSP